METRERARLTALDNSYGSAHASPSRSSSPPATAGLEHRPRGCAPHWRTLALSGPPTQLSARPRGVSAPPGSPIGLSYTSKLHDRPDGKLTGVRCPPSRVSLCNGPSRAH